MPEGPWLVVAISGRALAQSARRGGHATVVLDCFADRDTAATAHACRAVVARERLHFDRRALFAAARTLAPAALSAGLVYGSGFEGRGAWLGRLAQGRRLAGNHPDVIAELRDPRRFFPLLQRLGIEHPESRVTRPADLEGWLVKRPGSAGGVAVRWAASAGRSLPGDYYQRWTPGRLRSALFLADGRRALLVGCNRPWTDPRPGLPFLYGGAVGRIGLPPAVERDLRHRLDALVAATGLRGLNGLDFLLRGDRWFALELNPRPPATLELYDADWPRGLFDAHLHACRGELPGAAPAGPVRAHAIVRAPRRWVAPAGLGLPPWCADLPRPGLRFGSGDPVCTIRAAGPTPPAALRLLRRRRARLLGVLGRGPGVAAG